MHRLGRRCSPRVRLAAKAPRVSWLMVARCIRPRPGCLQRTPSSSSWRRKHERRWRSRRPTVSLVRTWTFRSSRATAGTRRSTPPTGGTAPVGDRHIADGRNRLGVPRLARVKDPAAQPSPSAGATRLILRGAAVDGDLTARDRRRPVTGQPGHDVRNLFGRHELLQSLLALVIDRVERHRRKAV
jgi:hypothetical protein